MSEPRQPVILGGARTPVGRLLGSLASKPASELGGVAIAGALARAGIGPDQVQYVIMGQVLQAGAGQITARQAAVAAGIPMTVPALTVNKVCLSGLDAIALADQLISAGEYDIIVAGGMESMTQRAAPAARSRARATSTATSRLVDSMALRRPVRRVRPPGHGRVHRRVQRRKLGISREEQDEFAAALAPARGGGGQERPASPTRSSPVHDPAAQGRAVRVHRGRGHPPATPPPSRWPSCGPPSPRTARSPPAPRRRSPTAPPRWW